MITLKTPAEIELMRQSGRILAKALETVMKSARPGMSTLDLDVLAEDAIREQGAEPAFKGYQGFPATICCSLNEELIHGIPSKSRILQEGDLVSIDLGAKYKGFFSDMADTFFLGDKAPDLVKKLLLVGKNALRTAIETVRPGITLGDLGYSIQSYVESEGFCVVRKFVGHGIGKSLHEAPEVPNYGRPGQGLVLKEGMTIAIEPMVTVESPDVKILNDGWTVVSADKKPCVHFEHTVLIKNKGAEILTLG